MKSNENDETKAGELNPTASGSMPGSAPQATPDSASEAAAMQLTGLTVYAGARCLLNETDAVFPDAKITVIVGGSGAGKSVLLRILAGLLPRKGDVIEWAGGIGESDSESARPRVGIVFQQFALFDELSAKANVQFALDHRSKRKPRPATSDGRARGPNDPSRWNANQWLENLGVPSHTSVSALSGGQKQRLAIARTLAAAPDILLYDEPTSGLDSASGRVVADLIRETQSVHHRTSLVVTHDYETLLPIADKVFMLDPVKQTLVEIAPDDWDEIPKRMVPVSQLTSPQKSDPDPSDSPANVSKTSVAKTNAADQRTVIGRLCDPVFEATGGALSALFWLPLDLMPIVPRVRWAARFTAHYLRLVAGPSAWFYLVIAGLIIGFTSTYFTFRFLPFRLYTQPLLIDELLSSIGFALYRVLVPILATVLIAARSGAAVSADVGVKQYGGQVDALKTLAVPPRAYLLLPIVIAFLIGTPLLEGIAFQSAKLISMIAFSASYPDIGPYFWEQHFSRNLVGSSSWLHDGWHWVMLKNLVCGLGTATIAYYKGLAPKRSASDVSHSITSTVLWTTLFVLTVHFAVALMEF